MKKLIAMLLALVMVFGLVACGAKTEAPAAAPEAPKAEAPAAADAPATEVPAETEGKEGGCKSSVAAGAAVLTAAAAAVALKKKED